MKSNENINEISFLLTNLIGRYSAVYRKIIRKSKTWNINNNIQSDLNMALEFCIKILMFKITLRIKSLGFRILCKTRNVFYVHLLCFSSAGSQSKTRVEVTKNIVYCMFLSAQ